LFSPMKTDSKGSILIFCKNQNQNFKCNKLTIGEEALSKIKDTENQNELPHEVEVEFPKKELIMISND